MQQTPVLSHRCGGQLWHLLAAASSFPAGLHIPCMIPRHQYLWLQDLSFTTSFLVPVQEVQRKTLPCRDRGGYIMLSAQARHVTLHNCIKVTSLEGSNARNYRTPKWVRQLHKAGAGQFCVQLAWLRTASLSSQNFPKSGFPCSKTYT